MNSILIVLPILTLLMFELGLTLSPSDFVLIAKRPKAMLTGMFGQLIILPIIACALAFMFSTVSVLSVLAGDILITKEIGRAHV